MDPVPEFIRHHRWLDGVLYPGELHRLPEPKDVHTSLPVVVSGLLSHAGFTFCTVSILLGNSEEAEWVGLT